MKRMFVAVVAAAFILAQHVCIYYQAVDAGIATGKLLVGLLCILAYLGATAVWNLRTSTATLSFSSAISILLSYYNTYQFVFEAQGITGGNRALVYMVLAIAAMIVSFFAFRVLTAKIAFQDAPLADVIFYGIAGACVLLMLVNLIFGTASGDGSARLWIQLPFFSFQPGEVVKIGLIYLGSLCYRQRSRMRFLAYLGANMFVCMTLVMLKDFGNVFVIFAVFLIMIYLLFDNRVMSIGMIISCMALFFLVLKVFPYAQDRMDSWGNAMMRTDSYQQKYMIESVLFGGIRGTTLANHQFVTGIFAINCDGAIAGIWALHGPLAMVILLGAYAGVIYQSATNFGFYPSNYLVLVQCGAVVFFQVMLNMLGSLDVIPFTGVVAPFVSSGGTAMITFGVLLGMAMSSLDPKLPVIPAQEQERKRLFCWGEIDDVQK